MKITLRKLLATAVLCMAALSVSAQSVKITGDVGLESNLIYRGTSLSDKNPSVNGSATVSAGWKPMSLYAKVDGASVNVADKRALVKAEAGVQSSLFGADVSGGYRYVTWVGGASSPKMNYDEAFVKASVPLFGTGKVFGEYAKGLGVSSGYTDQYAKVGYQQSAFLPQLTLGTAVSAKRYEGVHVTKFNNAEVFADLALSKRLNAYALGSFGGKDSTGTKIGNYGGVGVRYSF